MSAGIPPAPGDMFGGMPPAQGQPPMSGGMPPLPGHPPMFGPPPLPGQPPRFDGVPPTHDKAKRETAPAHSPYFEQLAKLARELESLARGGANPTAMRMLRQRLVEWAENWRSTDGNTDLAAAVEALIARLGRAIAAADLATEALAIAAELASLAAGAPPPPAPKKSRAAFWK
jgi:hypothetical protein